MLFAVRSGATHMPSWAVRVEVAFRTVEMRAIRLPDSPLTLVFCQLPENFDLSCSGIDYASRYAQAD